ncbi:MAG: GGDEF domain-containing protein [Campylobacterota bacterium]
MKQTFFKSTTFKLIILILVVVTTIFAASYLFNSHIDKLKKQIDYIYFGNFIPVVKLENIKDSFRDIVSCRTVRYNCDLKKEKTIIEDEWNYYFHSYKTQEEQKVVDSIDKSIKQSFQNNKLHLFKNVLKQIDYLIDYETQMAYKQRNKFIDRYTKMKDFLFYNIIFITITAFVLMVFIVYLLVKKDKQLRILNKKYKIDSITDSMTKLYNRKYFDTIFDNMPFISNENSWKCAFIILDIDFFKQYNDTYGHDLGDETLKKIALLLKDYFNEKYEFVFRLGGEEFGVILFDIDEQILHKRLKTVNKKIVELGIEHKNSKILDVVSISIGAVIYEPNSHISSNHLYKLADKCLYKSKDNGRNQYHIYKGS